MAIRQILKSPDVRLRQKSSIVAVFDKELDILIKDMIQTIRQVDTLGYGLAAVQFGIPARVIVAETPKTKGVKAIINPVYKFISKTHATKIETCLSEPGLKVKVKRATRIVVTGQDSKGVAMEVRASGLLARVIQHEMEHLEGVLLEDYIAIADPEVQAEMNFTGNK